MAEVMSLENELQHLVIDACNIPDAPTKVDPDAPLIGPDSAFGLDSLDAVELVVAVQKKYDVRIGGQDSSREVLQSLRVLADFIRGQQAVGC